MSDDDRGVLGSLPDRCELTAALHEAAALAQVAETGLPESVQAARLADVLSAAARTDTVPLDADAL